MEFEYSEKVRTLQARIEAFMAEHIYPNEESCSPKSMKATDGSRLRCSKS